MALLSVLGWYELLIIVTFLTLLVVLAYYFAFKYWKNKGVPCITSYSIFGHMNSYIFQEESAFETITRHCKEFSEEPFFGMYFGWKPVLVIKDPEILKCVMIKDFINFQDRLETVNDRINPLDANLIFIKGEKWRLLRSKLTPAFSSGKIKNMFGIMRECADELHSKLSELVLKQQQLEVKDLLCKFTIDIIASCGFGLEREAIKDLKPFFREVGRSILAISFVRTIKRVVIFSSPFISKLFGISVFDHTNSGIFTKIVKDIVEYREENKYVRNDFLQLLIEIKNNGQISKDRTVLTEEDTHLQYHIQANSTIFKLSDKLIAAQCLAFFLGGFETSSSTMSFCLYELALNLDIQNRVREEVNTVLGEHGDLTYESIQDMEYLSRVIDETLRKYPVVPVVFRSCKKPYTIPGTNVTIDNKVSVFIPIYAIHHDPKHYPDPEKFDPDRFTKDAKRSRHHFAYLPFGEGPRMCIGMRFGLIETKLGIASLISRYKFSKCKKTDIPLKIDPGSRLAISIVNGIWLDISPLSSI